MANEITISTPMSGLTVSVQLYSGIAAYGSAFPATEVQPSTGVYSASVPANTPYGQYLIIASVGSLTLASGELWWDGKFELPVGLTMLQGLDPNNPMNVTPSKRTTGQIVLDISGDGQTTTTVTREP